MLKRIGCFGSSVFKLTCAAGCGTGSFLFYDLAKSGRGTIQLMGQVMCGTLGASALILTKQAIDDGIVAYQGE